MANEESFLYYSSDEEVFIGKITDAEIKKMASFGIETDNIPDYRRAKNIPATSENSSSKIHDKSDEDSDIVEVIELSSKNDSVQVISDSDDSFIDNVKPSGRESTKAEYDEKKTPSKLESFQNVAEESIWRNSTDLSSKTDFGEETSPSVDTEYEKTSASMKPSINTSGPTDMGNLSLNAISDSVLNISPGSTISSPVYEDITETDLHMSVDETDYHSAMGSDVYNLAPTSDRVPSSSSYYTAYSKAFDNDTSAQQSSVSFEQYRIASENLGDLEELDDIKNSIKETSFEAVVQIRQNSFSGISSCTETTDSSEKPQKRFASKLPVLSSSSLIKPPKLVFKEATATSKPSKPTKQASTPRLHKATSVPTMLPKPISKTPMSKLPTNSARKTPIQTPVLPKALSSSKKNNNYGNIISPIRAYINSNPTVLLQSGEKRVTLNPAKELTSSRSVGKSMKLNATKANTINKRLQFNNASKEGQENVDPKRDTLPPRAFEHVDTVFMEEPEHPAPRLPKMCEHLNKMISPSMKITAHKGRVNEMPAAKGVLIPRITVQSPSPRKQTKDSSQHKISIRLEKHVI